MMLKHTVKVCVKQFRGLGGANVSLTTTYRHQTSLPPERSHGCLTRHSRGRWRRESELTSAHPDDKHRVEATQINSVVWRYLTESLMCKVCAVDLRNSALKNPLVHKNYNNNISHDKTVNTCRSMTQHVTRNKAKSRKSIGRRRYRNANNYW